VGLVVATRSGLWAAPFEDARALASGEHVVTVRGDGRVETVAGYAFPLKRG
jgi:hypothetical protein